MSGTMSHFILQSCARTRRRAARDAGINTYCDGMYIYGARTMQRRVSDWARNQFRTNQSRCGCTYGRGYLRHVKDTGNTLAGSIVARSRARSHFGKPCKLGQLSLLRIYVFQFAGRISRESDRWSGRGLVTIGLFVEYAFSWTYPCGNNISRHVIVLIYRINFQSTVQRPYSQGSDSRG